jgi:thiamine biosynthesis protein ThiS
MAMIEIYINDLLQKVPADSSLESLLQYLQEADPDLIVELNGKFVYPRDYAITIVSKGDQMELINPNFGG